MRCFLAGLPLLGCLCWVASAGLPLLGCLYSKDTHPLPSSRVAWQSLEAYVGSKRLVSARPLSAKDDTTKESPHVS